jgi:hypothetical protein
MIYNSNLDRSKRNRKTKGELKQELKKWEEGTAKRKKVTINAVEHEVDHFQLCSFQDARAYSL